MSGQNAALVSYKIPSPGQGFKVQIKAVNNPDRKYKDRFWDIVFEVRNKMQLRKFLLPFKIPSLANTKATLRRLTELEILFRTH